ncbi:MAG: FxsA family protein [Moraxella sp.]|uniref:FxsA family protein n=1 Tax=Moraxella sp. TaxID=479 RepID=UPI0026DB6502|nr:FxsA family protein [Moraxella sp.]MDO4450301.1 FxsA family protein [Moraxella sp.]
MGVVVGILLVWFIIEMLVWYLLAQFMSGWLVFIWFIVAIFIGLALIKKSASTLNPMAQQMKAMQNGVIPNPANQPPEATVTKSVAMGLAGILFLLPGLLTDAVAFLLLLPAIQKTLTTKAKDYAMKNQDKMMAMMAKQMGGQSPFGGMGGMGGNPFGGMGGMGGQNPFGQGGFGSGTTIDGQAKIKGKSANDD